jgi:CubicO group peptidase (beta-lactamase class C family)
VLLAVAPIVPPIDAAKDRFQRIRERIVEELDKGEISSLAVAVSRKDQILWEEAFGWADREKTIRATLHTMYSLASVTKPLTASGLMILVERGDIDLDRPMNDYLGEVKLNVRIGKAEKATVRRVANHTSGLPLHHHFFPEDEPYPRPAMEVTIRRYGNLVTEPGEEYQYSNLGYGIVEHAIERVSRKTFAAFMQEEVFGPLGLEHTAVVLEPDDEGRHAVRYDGSGKRLPFYDFDHASTIWCDSQCFISDRGPKIKSAYCPIAPSRKCRSRRSGSPTTPVTASVGRSLRTGEDTASLPIAGA